MNVDTFNLVILILLVVFISNKFIGIIWDCFKIVIYLLLFLIILKQIYPKLYNQITSSFNKTKIQSYTINFMKNTKLTIKKYLPFLKSKYHYIKSELDTNIPIQQITEENSKS